MQIKTPAAGSILDSNSHACGFFHNGDFKNGHISEVFKYFEVILVVLSFSSAGKIDLSFNSETKPSKVFPQVSFVEKRP